MESTLPGREWIDSLAVIDKNDILATYTPGLEIYLDDVMDMPINGIIGYSNYYTEIAIKY